ncbi:hypothetical protein HAPS_1291 [Glaesserella parasuis SH0165]|uniref:Uncharacterized protein n=1 Tax=Glaesserella parasuis serovar 5 (strain SH0165) TaxID=557723 RepID=B8F6D1_GLAP5|nr:hypothetical protein HAPS_1291 [Glaesserella parasuis SH0165]
MYLLHYFVKFSSNPIAYMLKRSPFLFNLQEGNANVITSNY